MAFSVTNTFAGASTLDPTDLDENFDDVENILNAGLTTANLSSAAGITNAQLANDDFTCFVSTTINAAAWATAIGGKVAIIPFPDYSGSVYTVIGYAWTANDIGDTTAQFDISFGSYSAASNAWANATTVLGTTTLVDITSGGVDTPASGGASLNVDVTPSTSGRPKGFAIGKVTAGADFLTAATTTLVITIFLKRKNGLGSY